MRSLDIVVAYDRNHGIGREGDLLWRMGEMQADMQHFRKLTRGATVIMGRKTLESIGHPLPNRRNIIVSRTMMRAEGIEVVPSLNDADERSNRDERRFIIGGGQIYKQALSRVNRVYATEVDAELEADTFFPELSFSEWRVAARIHQNTDSQNIYPMDFITYERTLR